MAKTKRLMSESLSLVDVVVEVLDARIPISSKNPEIDKLAGDKPKIVILNKADIASEKVNALWKSYFEKCGHKVVLMNSLQGKNINFIIDAAREMLKEKMDKLYAKGLKSKDIKMMIAGIPNVGKSTIINKMAKKTIAATADKPGVTKSNRWIKVEEDVFIMDTPGILWPKFEDEMVGKHLAFVGSIKQEILDIEELAYFFVEEIKERFPECLIERYNIKEEDLEEEAYELIEKIGRKRGCLMSGGKIDRERVSKIIIDDFRSNKMGKISLEFPEGAERIDR
jgi:ribosome biogenesis GTPase A